MKKLLLTCLMLLLLLPSPARGEEPRVGLCMYSGKDTFIISLVNQLQAQAEGRVALDIVYAGLDQNRQNDQVRQMLAEGVDVLVINPVDRTSAVYLIALAKKAGVPVILINREPLGADLDSYALAYYVGIDPKQQGRLEGELTVRYFQEHPEADLNGDGQIQLVLLRGEPGHQDAELRSLYALRAINASRFKAIKLGEETASWEKAQGQERMAVMLNAYGGAIECVLSNNDDMALGAIDALKAAGYFTKDKTIPVIGVDATAPALDMIAEGPLYATVHNDALAQAEATMDLAVLLARGEQVTAENYPFPMKNRVVYIDSTAVTR
ncbi:MAG: galactose ABC transporter substrate-binding protein [Christensenellales bacterium]